MIKYKLTTQDNKTRVGYSNETLWGENVTHKTDGKGELCGPGWLHHYSSPLLAVLLNPGHANIHNPKLWECEAEGDHLDDLGLKGGCTKLTTIREIPLPEFTPTQRVAFGILCAKEVYSNKEWNEWAYRWLSGEDRTEESANAAANAADYAAYAAYYAAYAAYYAANAANAAANTANAANTAYYAANAADYAAYAANAANAAANAADYAAACATNANAAANSDTSFSLQEIAEYCINNF